MKKRLVVGPNGDQELVDLTTAEITELEQIAIVPKLPRTADKRRLREALFILKLLDPLEAAIAAAGRVVQMQWQDTTVFHEDAPLVQTLIQGLGWDEPTVNSIFEKVESLS